MRGRRRRRRGRRGPADRHHHAGRPPAARPRAGRPGDRRSARSTCDGNPRLVLDPRRPGRRGPHRPGAGSTRRPSRTPAPADPGGRRLADHPDAGAEHPRVGRLRGRAGRLGEEALEMARRRHYGLFLIDVEMPGIDGFTFVDPDPADPASARPAGDPGQLPGHGRGPPPRRGGGRARPTWSRASSTRRSCWHTSGRLMSLLMTRVRVLVVEDSATMRATTSRESLAARSASCEVVGEATRRRAGRRAVPAGCAPTSSRWTWCCRG